MKKLIFIYLGLITNIGFSQISTPQPSPLSNVTHEVGLTKVEISYSRPSVKGRKIFGNIVPYGQVWRTGANKITSFKIGEDIMVEGKMLKAGSYGVYTFPNLKTWTIVFNSDDQQWGAYEYKVEKDVLRIDVPVSTLMTNQEQLEIRFSSVSTTKVSMSIAWEKAMVKLTLEQNVKDRILAEIKDKTSQPNPTNETLFGAADYYYENNMQLAEALAWAQKVSESDKQYWNYQLVARIAAKMGKCDVAIPAAEKSMELAIKEKDDAYVAKNKEVFKKCKK